MQEFLFDFLKKLSTHSASVEDISNLVGILEFIFYIVGLVLSSIIFLMIHRTWFSDYLKKRKLEKNFGSGLFGIDTIKRSTRHYVLCDATSIDPTRHTTIVVRQNIFEAVNEHLLSENSGAKYLLLLADSGMGKTSFLLNYWVYNQGLSKRKRHKIYMIPLSRQDAIQKIKAVQDKQNTVIFLDAFDEDVAAINDHRVRLDKLIQACQDFQRVLITCRTQFFAKEEDIPKATNIIYVGPRKPGQSGKYEFYKLYIAPFTDQQIDQYVNKRFPFWQPDKQKKAHEIISHINDLRVRPMLLSYIEYFLNDGATKYKNIYQIYKKLIDAWVEREAGWISSKSLYALSKKLAFDLYNKKEELGGERLPKTELLRVAGALQITIEEKNFVHSHSLLNSDGEGNYKFAHRSIMEFLFVEYFLDLEDAQRPQLEWTDMMRQFVKEKIQRYKDSEKLPFSLCMVDLSELDLTCANLVGTNLKGTNLEHTDLEGAKLESVQNFKQILSLKKTCLKETTGLSQNQLAFAKNQGADLEPKQSPMKPKKQPPKKPKQSPMKPKKQPPKKPKQSPMKPKLSPTFHGK